jgi:hypothetical protein
MMPALMPPPGSMPNMGMGGYQYGTNMGGFGTGMGGMGGMGGF